MLGTGLTAGIGAAFLAAQFIPVVGEAVDGGAAVYEGADFIGTLMEASDAGGRASVTLVSGLNAGMIGAGAGAAAGASLTAPMCGGK